MTTKIIDVYPNPYIALDKDGVPQGTVTHPGMPNTHVGAMLDLYASQAEGKERFYFPLGRDRENREKPGDGRVRVHFSPEIAMSVRSGELIAADAKTASLCGVKEFKDPLAALEREKDKALKYYRRLHGEAAQIKDIPREATPKPADPNEVKVAPTAPRPGLVQLTDTVSLHSPKEQ